MKWREVRLEIRKCGNDSYRLLLVGVFLFCGDGLCDGEYMQKNSLSLSILGLILFFIISSGFIRCRFYL